MINTLEELIQDYARYSFTEGTIDENTSMHLIEDAQNYIKALGKENLLSISGVSGSADANYWSERCKHAENIYENCPCDPDITDDQIEAISGYHKFIKENGSKHYR